MTNVVSIAQSGANNVTMRNRIINGAMVIDQRNAGAAITINSAFPTYSLDRWRVDGQPTDGVFTVQKSTTAPAGFTNSLLATVTTADASIGSTQLYLVSQAIEGFNIADFGFGAAGAQTVTLSFWVRSSVTGTFGGALMNGASNYSYPFTFAINSANTFEYKTITITGATAGTWLTDNGAGLRVWFSLGTGSTYLGTSGSWAATGYYGATGQTNLIATNGATFYITGVQLEKGTAATPFEQRLYGTELALCQRYFYALAGNGTVVDQYLAAGQCNTSTQARFAVSLPSTMRVQPTITPNSASNFNVYSGSVAPACTDVATTSSSASTNTPSIGVYATVASGLTAGYGAVLLAAGTSAKLSFSAEL